MSDENIVLIVPNVTHCVQLISFINGTDNPFNLNVLSHGSVLFLQDTCLAEVSLALAVRGDVSLPDLRPGQLALSVRTLLAELHEGLFHSELLLLRATPEADTSSGETTSGILD